jgi:hypothetical protein
MELFPDSYAQRELSSLLIQSTVGPATYVPSEQIRNADHVAVFAGSTPVVLLGPSGDGPSIAQAQGLVSSGDFAKAVRDSGYEGPLQVGVVSGHDIQWKSEISVLAAKEAGEMQVAGSTGDTILAMLPYESDGRLATVMSVKTEMAQAIDPNAPDLGDGERMRQAIELDKASELSR